MVLQLTQIDFDSLENNYPLKYTILGIFTDNKKLTAHGNAKKWFANQKPYKLYLGYDGKVYPQFCLEKVSQL